MIDGRPLTDVFEARFEPTHLAASRARRELRSFLDDNGVESGLADDVELAASELLSNAVEQPSAEPVEVEIHLDGATVHLTVTNHHRGGTPSALPSEVAPAEGERLAERGRGLAIVHALADGMWLHGGSTWTSVTCLHTRRT